MSVSVTVGVIVVVGYVVLLFVGGTEGVMAYADGVTVLKVTPTTGPVELLTVTHDGGWLGSKLALCDLLMGSTKADLGEVKVH